jgi:hypothetical protein
VARRWNRIVSRWTKRTPALGQDQRGGVADALQGAEQPTEFEAPALQTRAAGRRRLRRAFISRTGQRTFSFTSGYFAGRQDDKVLLPEKTSLARRRWNEVIVV